jgi:predicted anti-sigma-YlaC factor YlaD
MIEGLRQRITNEPVMTQALVQSAVALVVGFGLDWTPEQIGLVLAFSAMLLSFIARQQVTPTAKFDDAVAAEAETILQEDLRVPTAEEWATLDQLRAERNRLDAQRDARRLAVQARTKGHV